MRRKTDRHQGAAERTIKDIRLIKYVSSLFDFLFIEVKAEANDKAITTKRGTVVNGNLANLGRGDVDRQDGAPVPLSDAESPQFDIDADEFPTERTEQFEAIEESLIENARSGLVPETICCLATHTKTNDTVAEHCLFKASPSALVVLCTAYSLSSSAVSALLQLRKAVGGDKSLNTVSLLRRYESTPAHKARQMVQSTRSPETKKDVG